MGYYNFKAEGATGAAAYYLGTLNHGSTMNVASKYQDYASLTSANFLIIPQTKTTSATPTDPYEYVAIADWYMKHRDTNSATYTAPSVNYNASTGVLSFSSTVACGGEAYVYDPDNPTRKLVRTTPSATAGLAAKVYLVPKIENL